MYSAAIELKKYNPDIELGVATLYDGAELKELHINSIRYYLIPDGGDRKKYNSHQGNFWKEVERRFVPNIVHIHGSEYPHGLAYATSCINKNVVVSIQGIVSVYEKYYFGGISSWEHLASISLRDLIKRDTIFSQRKNMRARGVYEKELLRLLPHVIGRTKWDKAHTLHINPNRSYYHCDEILRSEFYGKKWSFRNCSGYTIFLSQAHYPIKGIQKMLEALPTIISQFPETVVYVAGSDFVSKSDLRISGFGKYVKTLIKKNGLEKKVIFTGVLSSNEMSERLLSSHVFVCPSSIENSPNSIGEAQLLGVPCVASYVGGMSNMIEDNVSGLLYRFEEAEMLAASVCEIFKDVTLAQRLSQGGITASEQRHDPERNSRRLKEIYSEICSIS